MSRGLGRASMVTPITPARARLKEVKYWLTLEGLGYVVDWFDRGSYRREDPAEVARLRAREDARALLDRPRHAGVAQHGERPRRALPMSEIEALGGAQVEALLGPCADGAPIFVALLADEAVEMRSDASDGFLDRRVLVVPGRDDLKLIDLRSIAIGGLVPQDQTAMLAAAKALMHWHARHRFCSNCGAPTEVAVAGWRRDCPVCKATHFPAHRSGRHHAGGRRRCLPARPPAEVSQGHVFGARRFRRARRDDRGCGQARNPRGGRRRLRRGPVFRLAAMAFPRLADDRLLCSSGEPAVEIDRVELEDARWFSREEALALLERRHPDGLTAPMPMAIAHHLLKRWAYKGVTFNE